MIETASQLLEEFKRISLERIQLEDADIKHTVAIGDNFEGFTAELLARGIFKGFDLRIVERSFIYNDSGVVSNEFDCLLVVGNGIKMSFADRYKYHIKDVIAVIQVKKNLYANEIHDAHDNLRSVIKVSEPRDGDAAMGRMFRDSYKILVGKELPNKERRKHFTDRENIIYHYLMMEAFHPLRIVIGYYGYKSEYSLREGMVSKMEKLTEDGIHKGWSPYSFPSLFICGNFSILKNNAQPIGFPLQEDLEFYFDVLFTSANSTMYHLLDLIWTRLSYKFDLDSSIFGDEYGLEPVHPFLSCKERKTGEDSWAWEFFYRHLSKKELEKPLVPIAFEPCEIDDYQYSILVSVVKKGEIDLKRDIEFKEFILEQSLDINDFIKGLLDTKLVYVDEGKLRVLVNKITFVISDGKIFAGDDWNEQMSRYFRNKMNQVKKDS